MIGGSLSLPVLKNWLLHTQWTCARPLWRPCLQADIFFYLISQAEKHNMDMWAGQILYCFSTRKWDFCWILMIPVEAGITRGLSPTAPETSGYIEIGFCKDFYKILTLGEWNGWGVFDWWQHLLKYLTPTLAYLVHAGPLEVCCRCWWSPNPTIPPAAHHCCCLGDSDSVWGAYHPSLHCHCTALHLCSVI